MARSKELYMKKQSGFTLVELLVAMTITLVVVAATLGAFNDALRANEAVTLLADMDQNLRAGMNLVIRDLIHSGAQVLIHVGQRSEEHTSELQSLRHLVCRLLLEKIKK